MDDLVAGADHAESGAGALADGDVLVGQHTQSPVVGGAVEHGAAGDLVVDAAEGQDLVDVGGGRTTPGWWVGTGCIDTGGDIDRVLTAANADADESAARCK